MKKFFTFIAAALFAFGANAQILYKISGKDLKKPSYIVGSHHLVTSSFVDKIPGMKDVMDKTQQVYGEISLPDMTNPDSVMVLTNKMMLPEGKTIKDVLTEEQYTKLNAFLAKIIGADLSNPQLSSAFGKMTPTGITNQLTVVLGMSLLEERMTQDNQFDLSFQKKALADGKTIGGLETMSLQASVLYGKSMERQVDDLMCLIENAEAQVGLLKHLTDAYIAQDLNKMNEISEFKFNNQCDSTPEEEEQIIYGRNADWIKKMPAIMADKPTLFVVGSLHLPREKGVLSLLQKAGYKIEAVK